MRALRGSPSDARSGWPRRARDIPGRSRSQLCAPVDLCGVLRRIQREFTHRIVQRNDATNGSIDQEATASDGKQDRAEAAGGRLATRRTGIRAGDHGNGRRVPEPTDRARSQRLSVV